jgi:hypothetical protein
VHSFCDTPAKYPRLGGRPTATEGEPAEVEEDNHSATAVVLVTALACDVVGLGSELRSIPSAPRGRRSVGPGGEPRVHRGCDDTEPDRALLEVDPTGWTTLIKLAPRG